MAEVVWVLESFYGYPKSQISETITHFLRSDGLEVFDRELMVQALGLYGEKNIDFADALLAQFALNQDSSLIYSFDNHFSRIPGIMKMKPGNLPD